MGDYSDMGCTNEAMLELMKESRKMTECTTMLNFIGCVNDLSTTNNLRYGDIVMREDNNLYMWTGADFMVIGDYCAPISDIDYRRDKPIELKERKCPNCGAPLRMYDKYSSKVKCEYCNSIFSLEEI